MTSTPHVPGDDGDSRVLAEGVPHRLLLVLQLGVFALITVTWALLAVTLDSTAYAIAAVVMGVVAAIFGGLLAGGGKTALVLDQDTFAVRRRIGGWSVRRADVIDVQAPRGEVLVVTRAKARAVPGLGLRTYELMPLLRSWAGLDPA